jgi:DNA mismatch endonuclease (patch repair protein)
MADLFSPAKRSEIMRAVKSKGNKSTELKAIAIFKRYNITGWRRNYPLFGRPDFVFPAFRTAVFLDGCFWHGHGCRNYKPKDNRKYWVQKILKNQERDQIVTETLAKKRWKVSRIWECEIKKGGFPLKVTRQLKRGVAKQKKA